jgi:hypothetical protein
MQKIIGSLFFYAIISAVVGCHNSSEVHEPRVYAPGEYSFRLNGISYERHTAQKDSNTSAIASISDDVVPGKKLLHVNLLFSEGTPTKPHIWQIGLFMRMQSPIVGTSSFESNELNIVSLYDLSNSMEYYSNGSGTITLTEFDTVNNVVSGSFNFDAIERKPSHNDSNIVHITEGVFNKIPIDGGSFGQGIISAIIDGKSFSTASGLPGATINIGQYSGGSIQINAYSGGNPEWNDLNFGVFTSKPGTYILDGAHNSIAGGISKTTGNISIHSFSNATGTFTLTKFDSISQRLSGTFEFSGIDTSTGKTIDVTNGIIDNVHWIVY